MTWIFDSSLVGLLKPRREFYFKSLFGLGFPRVFMNETDSSTLWQCGLHAMDEDTVFPDRS